MIPRYDVEPIVEIDIQQLKVPDAEDVADGFVYVHEYEPLVPVGWAEVLECLEFEDHWLTTADAEADSPAEFDKIMDQAESGDEDDIPDGPLQLLDLGVAGLSLALCAAGCVTFCSCRAHNDHRINTWTHPQVGFAADADRALIVARLAREIGCGLGNAVDRRYLVAYASSLSETTALAKAIYDSRADFDALPPPGWFAGLERIRRERDWY
ncbi:hypothetical protein [Nonomuraea polychroma]|nr:hypothetical protein [Nonomuraea polychroma]